MPVLGLLSHAPYALLTPALFQQFGRPPVSDLAEVGFVFITIMVSLAILVLLGRWWEERH